jgi:hypothetical protein
LISQRFQWRTVPVDYRYTRGFLKISELLANIVRKLRLAFCGSVKLLFEIFLFRLNNFKIYVCQSTDYGLDNLGSIPGTARFFFSPQRPARVWGPLSLLSNGYRGSLPGGKRQGSEADHSPPTSAEVKNGGAIPPPTHTFMT